MSATRPRVLVPGLLPSDPARETYRVRPGAQVVLALAPGDRVAVRDVHGAQAARASSEELGIAADLFGAESAPGAEERADGLVRRKYSCAEYNQRR